MKLRRTFAQCKTPAFSGVWPGSDRDTDTYPLGADELEIIAYLRMTLPAAQKAMNQHGLVFLDTPAEGETPASTRYCCGWYECIDCKARDEKRAIKVVHDIPEFKRRGAGFGQMSGIKPEFPRWNATWKNPKTGAMVGRDETWTCTIFNGWVCESCASKRRDAVANATRVRPEAAQMAGTPTGDQ